MPSGGHKLSPKPFAPTLEPIARGVWLMRGGLPKRTMNVYLLEDDGGVTIFDAGIKEMAEPLRHVAERMGGLKRVVLGHSHASGRRSYATRTRSPTPRETAATTTSTWRSSSRR